jgi:hypothetical protein
MGRVEWESESGRGNGRVEDRRWLKDKKDMVM